MNEILLACLCVYLGLGTFFAFVWAKDCPEQFSDFTIIRILTGIPLIPILLCFVLFIKAAPFFTSKPFKKAKFKVGEEVMYKGNKHIIIRNEKDCTGNYVAIEINGFFGISVTEVPTEEVKKLSKLEQALK